MDYLVHHLLRQSAEVSPDHEALVHGAARLSYADVAARTASVAQGLRTAGVQPGDRVGILLEPSLPLVFSIFGVSQAGGVFVPIHHSLLPKQVSHIVTDCKMRVLITDGAHLSTLAETIEKCPSLELVVVVDPNPEAEPSFSTADFEELTRITPQEPWQDVAIEKDLAAILYTSGSTGRAKGVMLSHANVLAGTSIVSQYLHITERDRILACLPFSFDAGLNQLTTAFQQQATLVLLKFTFAREIVTALVQERITGLAGVPPLWSLLAQPSSGLERTDLSHLRYITNTGGAMPQKLLASLRKGLPDTDVVLMYGLTEAFRSTYLPPEELDRRPTSMGKAIPNTEILVINDKGERCGPGEPGELVHHGPTVSLGYWGQPKLTNDTLRPHPFPPSGTSEPAKVCYSGDLVNMDEDGFLYFLSRRDNMIKSSGFRISPTEVEEALRDVGALQEAAVIGIPDENLGQRIKAFIVPSEGASIDPDELQASCAAVMPRHMVPSSVEVWKQLPKTSSGKIDYPYLRRTTGV